MRKNAAKIHKEKTDAAMAERRKVIEQRVGQPKKLEGLSDGKYHYCSLSDLKDSSIDNYFKSSLIVEYLIEFDFPFTLQ